MAESSFKLPEFQYISKPIPKARKYSKKKVKIKYPLIHPVHKYYLIFAFLFLIAGYSVFTWISLGKLKLKFIGPDHNVVSFMTNQTNALENQPLHNLSYIDILADPNLSILITYPDGRKIGESIEGLIFNQITSAIINQSSDKWELTHLEPPFRSISTQFLQYDWWHFYLHH